jgi:ABC-type lipoprotein export system ATPase subunit
MIRLADVSKTYTLNKANQVHALHGINLEISDGEFLVITGRSGSGKTTLLNLAAGLTRPTSGKVMLDDVNLWELPDLAQSALRSQKMGFVFQFPSLLPNLTAVENVVLPTIFKSKEGIDSENSHQRAVTLLETVGLKEKLEALPRQLSAGQQQRVVIARALMNQPEVLLADEPTSDLDEQTETEIMELFSRIHKETGVTIVMVTHTSSLIAYGTRSIAMAGGEISGNSSKIKS